MPAAGQQGRRRQPKAPNPPAAPGCALSCLNMAQPAEHGDAESATSRLCIKNLPKHVNEARLKDHFSAKGEVTDVKVLRTRCAPARRPARQRSAGVAWAPIPPPARSAGPPALPSLCCRDGASRQMGFVGFRSPQEAAAALKYFNHSFIDTSRLEVEVRSCCASNVGAANAARCRSGCSPLQLTHQPPQCQRAAMYLVRVLTPLPMAPAASPRAQTRVLWVQQPDDCPPPPQTPPAARAVCPPCG